MASKTTGSSSAHVKANAKSHERANVTLAAVAVDAR
jgi:hypothetical protein